MPSGPTLNVAGELSAAAAQRPGSEGFGRHPLNGPWLRGPGLAFSLLCRFYLASAPPPPPPLSGTVPVRNAIVIGSGIGGAGHHPAGRSTGARVLVLERYLQSPPGGGGGPQAAAVRARGYTLLTWSRRWIFGFGETRSHQTCSPAPWPLSGEHQETITDRSQLRIPPPDGLHRGGGPRLRHVIERLFRLFPHEASGIRRFLRHLLRSVFSLVSDADADCCRSKDPAYLASVPFSTPWPAWAWAVVAAGVNVRHCWPAGTPGTGRC